MPDKDMSVQSIRLISSAPKNTRPAWKKYRFMRTGLLSVEEAVALVDSSGSSQATILPWEGMPDIYREFNVVSGIPGVTFQHFWMTLTGNGLGANGDAATMAVEQPMFTPLWASKVVDWSKIDIPAVPLQAGHP